MSRRTESEVYSSHNRDEFWMRRALELAKKAARHDEVPVGAVLVRPSNSPQLSSDGDEMIAQARNRREELKSPLGHAELIVLQRASQKLQSWRLSDCTLYVTLEPCAMCAGALVQARVKRVVFGAYDPKGGGVHSLYRIGQDGKLNHTFEVIGGILEKECGEILKDFFRKKREKLEKASE